MLVWDDESEASLLGVDDGYPGIGRVKLKAGKQPFNESSEYGDTGRISFAKVHLLFRHEWIESARKRVV